MENKFRYCILYIPDTQIHRVMNVIKKHIPAGRGEAFYPCMEYYRRDERAVNIKAMFPSYLFLYTDLDIKEVHEIISMNRAEINSGMRELAMAEKIAGNPDYFYKDELTDRIYDLSDLSPEEEDFIDSLRKGNGLLSMSSGYEETGRKYIVMEGPLKVFQDRIIKVDKHNRRAFLEFEINGRRAQAGFNCLPKTHWFPHKDSRLVCFEDGTEADLSDLVHRILSN